MQIMIKCIVTIIGATLTAFIIPWIRQKIDTEKMERFLEYIEIAVRGAEQLYTPAQWKEKKEAVYKYIVKKAEDMGMKINTEDIDLLIEGIVHEVKKG